MDGPRSLANENLKRLEEFESYFTKLGNGEVERSHEGNTFKGYPDEEKNFFKQYTAKKWEILHDFCNRASKPKSSMRESGGGVITPQIPSKLTMKENRKTTDFSSKPVPKFVNPAGQHDFEMEEMHDKRKSQNLFVSDVMGNEESFSRKQISSLGVSFRWSPTKKQKRYLGGEKRKTADKDILLEMGLLNPKYPKKLETISPLNDRIDSDLSSQKNLQENSNHGNGRSNTFSEFLGKLYARELQKKILGRHQLELLQQNLVQKKSSETGISPDVAGLRNFNFGSNNSKPEPDSRKIVNATNMAPYNDSSQSDGSAGAMKTKLCSSYSSSYVVPGTTFNLPPIGLLDIPPCTFASKGYAETLAQLRTAAKREANHGGSERNSSHHVNPLLKKGSPVESNGPFPQELARTEQISKTVKRPRKLRQIIRVDNEADLSCCFIPHFTMNFLNNVGPSQNSTSV